MPGQSVGRGELLLGERDVLIVLLGKVVLAVLELEGAAAPQAPPDNEHVEVYIGAK